MVVEIAITTVLGVFGAIASNYLWEKRLRSRITVIRIRSSKGADVQQLIDLYEEAFPDGSTNYTAEDVQRMIDDHATPNKLRHVRVEDIILAAKSDSAVVGFIFCHYYPDREKAIVSYYAVDKEFKDASRSVSRALTQKLKRILQQSGRRCEYLFFDVEFPGGKIGADEIRHRRARIRRLKQTVDSLDKKAYCLDFEYTQPKIVFEDRAQETPLTLLVVPLAGGAMDELPKEKVIEFLRFVFLDCYGDIYHLNDPRFSKYQAFLTRKILSYEKTLPTRIRLN